MIRGKGATKEGKLSRLGLPQPGEDEPLHALITATSPDAVKVAVDKVRGMCVHACVLVCPCVILSVLFYLSVHLSFCVSVCLCVSLFTVYCACISTFVVLNLSLCLLLLFSMSHSSDQEHHTVWY